MAVNISCNQKSKVERQKVMNMKRSCILILETVIAAVETKRKYLTLTFICERKEI